MNILLINTASREALVALIHDGHILGQKSWFSDRTLGRQLLESIDEVLKEAGLERGGIDRIAVHRGPGHYSALRTGIVTASALAWALGCELVEVGADNFEEIITETVNNTPVVVVKPQYD